MSDIPLAILGFGPLYLFDRVQGSGSKYSGDLSVFN